MKNTASKGTDCTVLLEHYKALRERFTSQGDRLWKRFHLFLAVHIALAGAFSAGQNVSETSQWTSRFPFLGMFLGALWFFIGAQELWYYDNARKKLGAFTKQWILPHIPGWTEEDAIPHWHWRKPFRFQFPHVGVTTFASLIPLLSMAFWGGRYFFSNRAELSF